MYFYKQILHNSYYFINILSIRTISQFHIVKILSYLSINTLSNWFTNMFNIIYLINILSIYYHIYLSTYSKYIINQHLYTDLNFLFYHYHYQPKLLQYFLKYLSIFSQQDPPRRFPFYRPKKLVSSKSHFCPLRLTICAPKPR